MKSHRVHSKFYKQFLAHLKNCDSLEKEGDQVLLSLENLYERLVLQSAEHNSERATSIYGILAMCEELPALLYKKHILAIEKCRTFLRSIMKDYGQNTDQLRIISLEYRQAIAGDMDPVSLENSSSPLLTLEWMENVAKMAQLELMRKKAIVYYIVTSVDAQHVLSIINDAHWSSNSPYSNIDMSYVRNALVEMNAEQSQTMNKGG